MTGPMLRKRTFTMMICGCKRHHKPTIPWRKRERRRARARETQQFIKEMRA